MPDPWTHPLPPNTRAVGTGDPANDADAFVDALTASGALFNVQNPAFAGGADPSGVTDSAAAFQAAVAAATVVSGEVIIPPGTYKVLSAIPLTGPVRIRGLGAGCGGGPTSAPPPNPAVIINGPTGSNHLFTFPFQGSLWGGLEISGISVSYTGTGDVFHLMNVQDSVFRDMAITLTAAGSMAFATTGSVSVLNVLWERVNITTTAAVRSSPMTSISSSIASAVSNNTWYKCKFSNAGLDSTQYMHYYACTTAGNGFHFADNFRDCWFEHPFGGCLQSLSGQSITIDGCTVWDIYPALGVSVGHSLFYFGAFSGNSGSQGVRFTGNSRSLNATLLDGTNFWDVECESTTSQVHVEGYTVRPAGSSIQTNVFFNFHGCNDVTLVNNVSPQGASVNGNSTTVIANPSPTQVMLSQGKVYGGGALGRSVLDPAFAGGADPTGTLSSTAAFTAAAAAGGDIRVPPGTYLLNTSAAIVVSAANTWFTGSGQGVSVIKIGASFTAASAFAITAASCGVRNLSIVGASSTITSNPVANGIEITGAGQCAVHDVFFQYVNGYAIEAVGTASNFNADMMIRSVVARNCAGVIHDQGVTGTSWHGEHFLTDIECQAIGVTTGASANLDAIFLEDIQDVLIQGVNVGIGAGTGTALHVKGTCASIAVSNADIGGATTSVATVLVEDSANGSPSGVKIASSVVQGGLLGLSVTGAAAHLAFSGILFTRSQGHGVSYTGTGVDGIFAACQFNTNNQANGTAYDFMFNSAAKLSVRDCIFQTTIGAGVGQVTNPVSVTGGDVTFAGCDFRGTNITVANAFASKPAVIRDCRNYNPVGSLSVTVPATTVAITADSMDRVFYITAGASTCSCALSGSGATVLIPSGGFGTVYLPARITLTPTYTAAPTWTVEGL